MFVRRIWRIFFFLVIVTGLVVGGAALYRLGFSHGALTNLTLPEGTEGQPLPYWSTPFGWHYGPRFGLLGFLPLLCLGGFFFLAAMFLFGFFGRRHAWMHYGPGGDRRHWHHHGPPPWRSERKADDEAGSKPKADDAATGGDNPDQ